MSVSVMMIVLLAALLHACWNFLVKRTHDKHVSMGGVVLGHVPYALAALLVAPWPRPAAVPYLLAGATLHTGYQLFLLNSYMIGDLSQIYPLARGAAPLMVAGVSVVFLGADLSNMELSAVVLIATGIMSLALTRQSDGLRNVRGAAFALATAVFIASYSLVDGLGARRAGTALGYYGCLSTVNAVIFAVILRIYRPGSITKVIGSNWRMTLTGGGASFAAYAMVTWAFTVAPIALVTALRETSIIFALLLGVFVLKERLNLAKLAATMLTLLGACMLRLKR